MQPIPEQEIMKRSYEEHASKYFYRSAGSNEHGEWIDEALEKIGVSGNILEVGSGNGWLADLLESRGYRVDRTDSSRAFVEYQRSQGHDASLLDLLTDAISQEAYQLIIAASVLHHFTAEQLPIILEKLYRGLAPGGWLAFRIKRGTEAGVSQSNEGLEVYYQYWEIEPLRAVVERAGFHIDRIGESGPKHIAVLAQRVV
jgi:2-polyprenyl-3-methyl-5-hydroxy-6-metoxy-1,4-benzoquinol methylase